MKPWLPLLLLVCLAVPAASSGAQLKGHPLVKLPTPVGGNYTIDSFDITMKAGAKLPRLMVVGALPAHVTVYAAVKRTSKTRAHAGVMLFKRAGTTQSVLRTALGAVQIGTPTSGYAARGMSSWSNLLGRDYDSSPANCGKASLLQTLAYLAAGQALAGSPRQLWRDGVGIACGMNTYNGLGFASKFGGTFCAGAVIPDGMAENKYKATCNKPFTAFGLYEPGHAIVNTLPPAGFTCMVQTVKAPNDYYWCGGGSATSVEFNLQWNPAPTKGEDVYFRFQPDTLKFDYKLYW